MSGREYAFEDFPRADLSFALSRRQLLTGIITQWRVFEGQERGGTGFRLASLGRLPDAELADLIPLIRPECLISKADGFICGKWLGQTRPFRLFPAEPAAVCAFNSMDGRTALGAIGRRVAHEMGWEPERGFAFARGLFLHLVQLRVCVIADAGAP